MRMRFRRYPRRSGLPAWPAALLLLLVTLPVRAPAAWAQSGKEARVSNTILGVGVGAHLDDVRARLEPLGTSTGRTTADGGRKEAWTLKGTDYVSVALRINGKGRVVWVTGFVRPGKEIPFASLGDLALAPDATGTQAIWNVKTPSGGYRLVAKGQNNKARVVYLLAVEAAAPPPPEQP